MTRSSYRPNDHYWSIGGSTTEVYSSNRNTIVPVSDPTYVAWLVPVQIAPDNIQTNSPSSVDSEAVLKEVLAPYNFFPEWLMAAASFIQPAEGAYSPDQLAEYSAHVRWQEEITGIDVNGFPVATDRKSQGLTATAGAHAETNTAASFNYKLADGSFAILDATKMGQVADAVTGHVQTCFDTEATTAAAITAGTITTLEQIEAAYEPLASRAGRKPFEEVRHWRVAYD